jgi:hypothetical protein
MTTPGIPPVLAQLYGTTILHHCKHTMGGTYAADPSSIQCICHRHIGSIPVHGGDIIDHHKHAPSQDTVQSTIFGQPSIVQHELQPKPSER